MKNAPTQQSLAEVHAERGIHVALISVHGRIRSKNLELGCEPDTGGQTLYVVELAQALARTPGIVQVDLFTRRIVDPQVGPDYAEVVEPICPGARIVRIECGPEEHIRKEELWDHLDSFADNLLTFLREEERVPDVIHGHYADAGYVGLRAARQLGRPLVFTGHSLGRIKRRRLLASGMSKQKVESRFNISRRIDAEEEVLGAADLVVTSTWQEVEEQYAAYDQYRPQVMKVLPPGIDLERFHPAAARDESAAIERVLAKFLRHPERPMVLSIARPDERKNLEILVQAFGENARLRETANLVVVAGNRDDLADEEESIRRVFAGLMLAVDRYDLYGHVALPKHHDPEDVPRYYRLAVRSGGVFANPALTEPFGLTLLEAAACGLPVVATEDGGPTEILAKCGNGLLVNPLDAADVGDAVLSILSDRRRRQEFSRNGITGVRENYSWKAHAQGYVRALGELSTGVAPEAPATIVRPRKGDKRAVFSDIDQNLLGDPGALQRFRAFLAEHRHELAFGIVTGRRMHKALEFLREHHFPEPAVLISRLGTAIHHAPKLIKDLAWTAHIDHLWNRRAVRRLLDDIPGLHIQAKEEQSVFKVSYLLDADEAPDVDEIVSLLRSNEQSANVFLSFGHFLDIVPVRASKGAALRYVADQWGLPLEDVLVAGGSGADEDMMRGNPLAAVVANRHQEELSQLVDIDRIYFSEKPYADGILEAIDHYDFLGSRGGNEVKRGRLLATDLDRTLLPNGAAEESPLARPLLSALVADLGLLLVYVTGRRLELVEDALREYAVPRPDAILADVGSTLYERSDSAWVASEAWSAHLAEDWQGRESGDLAPLFAEDPELELQEPAAQRAHKLSFYAPLTADVEGLLQRMHAVQAELGLRSAIVYSVDEAAAVGLVDVLPARSTKLCALEFLIAGRGLSSEATVFAGDSGNDREVLVSAIPAVLVANADAALRDRVLQEAAEAGHADRLYAARGGLLGMNGNYAAGILEGWIHFHPEDSARLEELARRRRGGLA